MEKFGYTLLLILLLNVHVQAADVNGVVVSSKGDVQYYQPGSSQLSPLKTGMMVPPGAKVVTGEGEVMISPVPSTVIKLDSQSTARFDDLQFEKNKSEIVQRKVFIALERGSIYSSLVKLDLKKTDFRIKTPRGVAAARGTTLRVWIDPGSGDVYVMNIPEGKDSKVGVEIVGSSSSPTIKEGETIILRVVNGEVQYIIRPNAPEDASKGALFQNESSLILIKYTRPKSPGGPGTITLPEQLGSGSANPSNINGNVNP